MAKQPKLKTLLEDIFNDKPQINKYEVSEGVRSFGIVGKSLYNNSNIMEMAKQLSHIAEQAHTHVMSETSDWFDKVSVSKNMKSLKGSVVEFKKTAMEANQLNQRLTGLYEDIGHVLNRYYEIDEADKGDMDNDGKNEPDDKEYLDSKRDAITKAVKGEAVGDPDNRDMVDRPDAPKRDGRDDENEALDTDKSPIGGGDEDDYAARDGEDMGESVESNPLNVDGNNQNGNWPSKDGEEMNERKSLKDVGGVVGIPSLGQIARKFTGK